MSSPIHEQGLKKVKFRKCLRTRVDKDELLPNLTPQAKWKSFVKDILQNH
jgi:hypothetical protein